MKKIQCLLAASFMLLAGVQSAPAALVAQDSRFGANTLILDTKTGFEWLRLDITRGMSFRDVLSQTGDGEMFSGFQTTWAAGASVDDLYHDNVFSPRGIDGVDFYLAGGTSNPTAVFNSIQFSTLFGGQVQTGSDGSVSGFLGGMQFTLGPGNADQCITQNITCSTQYTTSRWNLSKDGIEASATLDVVAQASNQGNPNLGTWLVMTPVPEPSTYALMLVGLAGVGAVVRRRSSTHVGMLGHQGPLVEQ